MSWLFPENKSCDRVEFIGSDFLGSPWMGVGSADMIKRKAWQFLYIYSFLQYIFTYVHIRFHISFLQFVYVFMKQESE